MDELVVVIIGVFIANFSVKEHPILMSCAKAFLVVLLGFLFVAVREFMNDKLTLAFVKLLSINFLIGWAAFSLFLMLVEFIFKGRK